MKCSKCGLENKPEATFCANCGTRVGSFSQPAPGRPSGGSGQPANRTMIVQSAPGISHSNLTEVLIGRASNCDIVINDSGVSSKHAKIFVENDDVYIEDLRSVNGTYLNGRKISGKAKINASSRVNVGNYPLDLRNPVISNLISKYGSATFTDSGVLSLKVNQTWTGKVFYFIMIILFFFPWLTIKGGTESFTFSALDFAFNKMPEKGFGVNKLDYGPLNTLFLVIFILLIIGLFMNFFRLKISDKLNWTNILSLVILIITIIYMYVVSFIDKSAGGFASFSHNFSSYFFMFICLISLFEGLIEFYIRERKNYVN